MILKSAFLYKAMLTLALCLFAVGPARATILFDGEWENFLGSFYGPGGWQNGKNVGYPTGNGDWSDIQGLWTNAPVNNVWLFIDSWAPDRIRLEKDPSSPKGGLVARFEVQSGDRRPPYNGGERAEVYSMLGDHRQKLPVTEASGHEFYGISVKLSKDWVVPEAEPPEKGGAMWGSFMQLHSPNVFNSPPALDLAVESDFHLTMDAGDLDFVAIDPRTSEQRHRRKGTIPFSFKNGDLRRGHWVEFMLDINWARDTRGSIAIYRRDEGEKSFTKVLDMPHTPTLQSDSAVSTDPARCAPCSPDNVSHYWRVGFYRSPTPDRANVLWLGPVVRGTSFDEVARTAFGNS